MDSVNFAGLEGRGESVMLTCQVVMCLRFMMELCEAFGRDTDRISCYKMQEQKMQENLQKYAMNKKGYFNGVFSDNGDWVFSDCDPDGYERPYGPANWFAVTSCTAKKEQLDDVFQVMELLKSEFGYRLYYPPMGLKPIPKVGRNASGDTPPFMAENGNVYNHGSQGFLARALARAGRGDELYDVLKWMVPCYQEKHPTYAAMTAPYAVINCWQELPIFRHRGMLSFLTGAVGMCVRGAYEWLGGIDYVADGIEIDPCMPSDWQEMSLSLQYRGSVLDIKIKRTGKKSLIVNGEKIAISKLQENKYHEYYFVPSEKLTQKVNVLEVYC